MSDAIRRLISLLRHLPGVGEKTASRFVYHILGESKDYGQALAHAISEVVERVRPCSLCGNLTEISPCAICQDSRRDRSVICVVEKVPDLLAIESTGEYPGLYHVLNGVLSPLNGIGPDQIRVEELLKRLEKGIHEVILATSASVEGEATALFLKKRIEGAGIAVSRIASGIPVGGELEYVDRGTIGRALVGRQKMS